MSSNKLLDLQGQIEDRRKTLAAIWEQAGPTRDMSKVTLIEGDTTAKLEGVRSLDKEITNLADQIAEEKTNDRELEEMQNRHAAMTTVDRTGIFQADNKKSRDDRDEQAKTIGQMFIESDAYKGRVSGQAGPLSRIAMPVGNGKMHATLMTTSAGWAPEVLRSGLVVPAITRPLQVIDLIPQGRTNQSSYRYMKETTFTNNAAETAQAGTYPESALALSVVTQPVEKIATFLPVTDEQLEDVEGIQSYIENRLGFMVRQRIDSQLLVGDGITPNLLGFNNLASIQTQAKGADPVPDAIYKAMTLIMLNGRTQADGVVMHPTDWADVRLLRTADGVYIWGNPADTAPNRIWGLTVALSDAQTLNTALVGDFGGFSQLFIKRDLEIQISNSHSTYFIEGKQAIRADMRCSLVVFRDQAFAKVTGV